MTDAVVVSRLLRFKTLELLQPAMGTRVAYHQAHYLFVLALDIIKRKVGRSYIYVFIT